LGVCEATAWNRPIWNEAGTGRLALGFVLIFAGAAGFVLTVQGVLGMTARGIVIVSLAGLALAIYAPMAAAAVAIRRELPAMNPSLVLKWIGKTNVSYLAALVVGGLANLTLVTVALVIYFLSSLVVSVREAMFLSGFFFLTLFPYPQMVLAYDLGLVCRAYRKRLGW